MGDAAPSIELRYRVPRSDPRWALDDEAKDAALAELDRLREELAKLRG